MKHLILLLCLLPVFGKAQSTLSLAECVDLLIKNNLTYKQGSLQAEAAQAQLRQTRSQILPQISITADQSLNIGRSIDQYTNTYIDQVYGYNAIGTGVSIPIFQGFKLQNQIRQGTLLKESAVENRTAVLNAQTVLLMQGYVNVLATNALLDAANQQVESSAQQVDRVSKQVDAGIIGSNLLFEIKSQLANDKFAQVTALNNYRTARLALFQRINISPDDKVQFEALTPKETIPQADNATAIYEDAQKTFPELRSAELYRQSFAYQVKSIKADNYPSLSLGGNMRAFYASTNANLDYFKQLNATRNGSIGISLNIPIMGRWVTRPRVEYAKVQERLAQNTLDVTNQQLRQAIELAVLNLNAMADKYAAATGQVESLTASFAVVESKLNAGIANIFEYSLAKANLAKAQANAIQAKYDYVMQQRLLQYYRQGNWTGVF
ncbi:TolC family protein [Dyadobacter chenhuakuii]|uniref:TolC family protein n=1 Tax=Dyadobacter chenhuakuii TaxID=2909339 RepID=A0ABY4XEB9_9BACT|nr:TolC family protein [Dyadobacter chenhuakuii]MCF2492102.1 TolC family protein [Dyadobacter chenhuakuii]USJ28739.1 TolC family protein [Dyadobacter chenhuakuii]